MSEHARFSPSSFSRIMACAGSHVLAARYPNEDSPASIEGTAAHFVAAERLQSGHCFELGHVMPNGVACTQEMIEGAEMLADYVARFATPTSDLAIEQRVSCQVLHPEAWGTPDLSFWVGSELHLVDYKFGHRFVSEFENWQLIGYAAGLLAHLDGHADQSVTVHMHIVQPRNYSSRGPCRHWTVAASDLRGYFNQLAARLREIDAGRVSCQIGEHCMYCPARLGCVTLQQAGYTVCDISGEPVALDLPLEAASLELIYLTRAASALKARIAGLEEQVEAEINRGSRAPHHAIVSSQGNERWIRPVVDVAAIGQMFGVDLMKKPDVVTPTQARKILPDPQVINFMTIRPVTQKLQEIDESEARRVFSR